MTISEYRRYRNMALAHIRMLRSFIDEGRFGKYSAMTALDQARNDLARVRREFYSVTL